MSDRQKSLQDEAHLDARRAEFEADEKALADKRAAGFRRVAVIVKWPQSPTSAQEGEGNWEYRVRHAHGTRWSDWSTREPPPTPGWVVEKQWVQHDITPVETQPSQREDDPNV